MGHGNDGGLLLLASLLSIQIAREVSPAELSLLSAFFTVLGDDLALLALNSSGTPTGGSPPGQSSSPGSSTQRSRG